MKLHLLAALLLTCLTNLESQASLIVWVTDNNGTDSTFTDHLSNDLGHTVDIRTDLRDLDATKVAQLEAADLIIVSRQTDSGNYSNAGEAIQWNGLTTPIIVLNAYVTRNNRWEWLNTDAIQVNATDTVTVEDAGDPAFAGMGLTNGSIMDTATSAVDVIMTWPGAGNETLIGSNTTSGVPWIARWDAGTPFYSGSSQTPAGLRIHYAAPVAYTGLSADGQQVFNNLVEDALVSAVPEPSSYILVLFGFTGLLAFRRRLPRSP